jgi:hypothetical protein
MFVVYIFVSVFVLCVSEEQQNFPTRSGVKTEAVCMISPLIISACMRMTPHLEGFREIPDDESTWTKNTAFDTVFWQKWHMLTSKTGFACVLDEDGDFQVLTRGSIVFEEDEMFAISQVRQVTARRLSELTITELGDLSLEEREGVFLVDLVGVDTPDADTVVRRIATRKRKLFGGTTVNVVGHTSEFINCGPNVPLLPDLKNVCLFVF